MDTTVDAAVSAVNAFAIDAIITVDALCDVSAVVVVVATAAAEQLVDEGRTTRWCRRCTRRARRRVMARES